jgi:hypothetical protein
MALSPSLTLEVIEALENYIQRIRPPEEIRGKLDIGWKIEGPSVIIYEIRPSWTDPLVIMEYPVAKTTYLKAKDCWKIFWKRADLKWHVYAPPAAVKSIKDFVSIVEEDKYHCFWG